MTVLYAVAERVTSTFRLTSSQFINPIGEISSVTILPTNVTELIFSVGPS
jgi:hypothetical protein